MEKIRLMEDSLVAVLRELHGVLLGAEIRCWLDQGILLGAVRNGRLIEYDNDVDMGILYDDAAALLQQIPLLKQRGFMVEVHCCSIVFIKNDVVVTFLVYQLIGDIYLLIDLTFINRRQYPYVDPDLTQRLVKIQRFYDAACLRDLQSYGAECLDWWAYALASNFLLRKLVKSVSLLLWSWYGGEYFGYVVPRHFYDSLDTLSFYGMIFNIPSHVEDYLEYKYGATWRIPCGEGKWDIYLDDGASVRHDEIMGRFKQWKTCEDLWRKLP